MLIPTLALQLVKTVFWYQCHRSRRHTCACSCKNDTNNSLCRALRDLKCILGKPAREWQLTEQDHFLNSFCCTTCKQLCQQKKKTGLSRGFVCRTVNGHQVEYSCCSGYVMHSSINHFLLLCCCLYSWLRKYKDKPSDQHKATAGSCPLLWNY